MTDLLGKQVFRRWADLVRLKQPSGGKTILIGGFHYRLSDDPGPFLSQFVNLDEENAGGARFIQGPQHGDGFKYMWVYNTDSKMLTMWRVTDGNEKHYGSAKEDVGLVVKLEKKGQLNRVSDHQFRQIESHMNHLEDQVLQEMKKFIEENEDQHQKDVTRLTREFYKDHVLPLIKKRVSDVERGVFPLGFKAVDRIPKTPTQQAVMFVVSQVLTSQFSLDKIDHYLKSKGVDLDGGDVQASYWAQQDILDEVNGEYAHR